MIENVHIYYYFFKQESTKTINSTKKSESDVTQQNAINNVAGVDNEYMRKLEEQKRLRAEIVRKKEQRRLQEVSYIFLYFRKKKDTIEQQNSIVFCLQMKRKRNDSTDKVKSNSNVNQTIDEQPSTVVATRKQQSPTSTALRHEKKPISSVILRKTIELKPNVSTNDATKSSNVSRNVQHPKSNNSVSTTRSKHTLSQKRTDVDKESKPSKSATPDEQPKRTMNERFSDVNNEKKQPPQKQQQSRVTLAVVVRDISKWDAAFGRLTIVAGTVGRVKVCSIIINDRLVRYKHDHRIKTICHIIWFLQKCWQPSPDAVAIVFEEEDKAIRFMQQYNG